MSYFIIWCRSEQYETICLASTDQYLFTLYMITTRSDSRRTADVHVQRDHARDAYQTRAQPLRVIFRLSTRALVVPLVFLIRVSNFDQSVSYGRVYQPGTIQDNSLFHIDQFTQQTTRRTLSRGYLRYTCSDQRSLSLSNAKSASASHPPTAYRRTRVPTWNNTSWK